MYIITRIVRSPLFWLLLGGLCYYLALPPVNCAPLALAVPICWGIFLRKERTGVSPPVKWYWVYCTAFLFWLASIWWIACPYPPLTALGMLALSAYLSLYWVLFFVSARVAVHRFHVPLLVAMPLCWIGTEYLRCHMLGGFSFCALEHTLYLYPLLIQFASIGGSLLVGGIIMFLGAAMLNLCVLCASFVSTAVKFNRKERQEDAKYANKKYMLKTGIQIMILLLLILIIPERSINRWTIDVYSDYFDKDQTSFSIVALQGNRQIYFDSDPAAAAETFRQFVHLTYQTIHDLKQAEQPLPDLIVFPETVCHIPVLQFEGTVKPADIGLTEEDAANWETEFRRFAQQIETPVLLGLSTYIFKDNPDIPTRLNSALYVRPSVPAISPDSSRTLRYDKMHLVMFGEYIPFTEYLPDNFFLKTLCPEAEHGIKPVAMPIGQGKRQMEDTHGARSVSKEQQVEASLNICFESSVAHLIRNQILALRKEGHDPRVLVNLSNDGWFRNSHQMEHHLATHVFRAVENRMYYVTASNGAFSAIISSYGEIQQIGKRGAAEAVSGTVAINLNEAHTLTIYQKFGDWYALPLAVGVLALAGFGFWERRFLLGWR